MPIEKRQDALRGMSRLFSSKPKDLLLFSEREIKILRASYAYLHDWQSSKGKALTRLPWDATHAMHVYTTTTEEESEESRYFLPILSKASLEHRCAGDRRTDVEDRHVAVLLLV